jgi:hypothetical protein
MKHRCLSGLTRLCAGLTLAAAAALPAQAITNSTPTTTFQAVGYFGVQVAPDWVLTVNHVAGTFYPSGTPYNNGFGDRVVIDRFDAPGAGPFPANDLTLLRLAPSAAPAFYLQISSDLYASGPLSPFNVTIVSAANTASARAYGFTAVSEFATLLDPDDAGPLTPVTVNYLISYDTSVYVQGGDSGGGLFLGHVSDGTSPLLGLSSALLTDDNNNPTGSAFVQLAAYRPWIDATLAAAAGNTQAIQWVSAVPEPASLLLFVAGAAAVGAMVRRRAA